MATPSAVVLVHLSHHPRSHTHTRHFKCVSFHRSKCNTWKFCSSADFFFFSLPTCRQFRGHCWQRPRTHGLLKQKQEHTVSSFSTPSDGHLASRLPSRARGSSPLIKTVSGFQSYNITRRTYLTVCFFFLFFLFFGLSVQNPSNLSFRKSYKSH